MKHPRHPEFGSVAVAAGPISAVVIAGVLSSFRVDVGPTNAALVLATIVVLAAMSSRSAGLVTALVAAASFNFFHTVPYRSLRIRDDKDVITVVLLVLVALPVSALSNWRRRLDLAARRRSDGEHLLADVAERLARGDSVGDLWSRIRTELIRSLHLSECRYETADLMSLPLMERTGSLRSSSMHLHPDGWALPPGGAAIEVSASGNRLGWIVLMPGSHSASVREQRRTAVAVADLFAVALARSSGPERRTASTTSTTSGDAPT